MENELVIRFGAFVCLFAFFAVAESALPRRRRVQRRVQRWVTNLGLGVLDSLSLRLLALALPALAVGAAADAAAQGWGLLNRFDWPWWAEGLLAILALDLAIWFQHLLTHKIPILWRLHRVHHADRDFDVSTALRFHPIEILLSMLFKVGVVYLLGPAVWAVVAFEVILNGTAIFNHANLALPAWLDRALRMMLVTPDMHRVHHSVYRAEHDSNYGFALSIWDRVFGTYVPAPRDGHRGMTVGLQWQGEEPSRLGWSLWLPFR